MLGTIIGMEFPTVTDFKVGFDQGAKAANPTSRSSTPSPAPSPTRPRARKWRSPSSAQGADVIFPIAGATGIGALQAVKDAGKLAVGVDSDQATIFAATDPAQADVIFTSVEKKVGESLYLALKGTIDGTRPVRQAAAARPARTARSASRKNQWYEKLVPADVRAEVDALEAKIASRRDRPVHGHEIGRLRRRRHRRRRCMIHGGDESMRR